MKRLLKRLRTAQTRGQSLVEMAIIAPILIFFLLGKALLALPSSFHEGTLWQDPWLEKR